MEVIRRAVIELHETLGHARPEDLVRILIHGGASVLAIREARNLKCAVCDEKKTPDPGLPRDLVPVSIVRLDFKEVPGWQEGQRVKVLNMLCLGSRFQMAVRVPNEGTEALREAY